MPTHDEVCDQARVSVTRTTPNKMAEAFVASLGTRDLWARAAFGSYVILRHLPQHPYAASEAFSGQECKVCGINPERIIGFSKDSLGKLSWMHHQTLEFCEATLRLYLEQEPLVPTERDRELWQELLEALRSLPPETQLSGLLKAVPKSIKSNKNERTCLLQILGYCGVLCPDDQKHDTHEYLTYDFVNSAQPPHFYKRDWAYPVRWWEGKDGVNDDMVQFWFGEL